jgi:hypothetical protein
MKYKNNDEESEIKLSRSWPIKINGKIYNLDKTAKTILILNPDASEERLLLKCQ